MVQTDPFAFATLAAEQLIEDLTITALPVDPFAIARKHDIEVMAKPSSNAGVSGMLIRVGNSFAIGYATHIDNVRFQRFSVSHELGHYFLPGHSEAVLAENDIHESRAGFTSSNRYEREADYFAAGLLMPSQLFLPALRRAGAGLTAVESLSDSCNTSLLATAIRLTQCTSDPIAIVVSTTNKIDYCFMSDALKELDGLEWIRKRDLLPKNTATFIFNQNLDRVRRADRTDGMSDLQDWFGGRRSIEVTEDVVGLGSYGKTLTILYDVNLPDEEEEADEDSLNESWTPRFHR
jgi:uncharacterized protein DUF955